MQIPRPYREQEAIDEIERTVVSRTMAWMLVGWFFCITAVPGLLHLVITPKPLIESLVSLESSMGGWFSGDPWAANRVVLQRIDAVDDEIRNGSPFAKQVRPPLAGLLYRTLNTGNSQVYPAGDLLYFQPSIDHLRGAPFLENPEHDPVWAIVHLQEDLHRQGVELVLLPVPAKPTLAGAPLGVPAGTRNPSWELFLRRLAQHGLPVVPAEEVLAAVEQPYLRTDTHWTWAGMNQVAARTAKLLRGVGVEGARRSKQRPEQRTAHGDLVDLLGIDPGLIAPDSVDVQALVKPLPPGHAPVLLLGDSFSNIYRDPTLGFGADAGFAERLSYHLRVPVEALIINDGGAHSTRRALADQQERLAKTEVVVWEFAARELSFGDWSIVPIGGADALDDRRYVSVGAGETKQLDARVLAVAPAASPSSSVYPDQIVAVHLAVDGDPSEAWAYAWSLRGRSVRQGAALASGDVIQIEVLRFSDAPARAHSASRSDLSERAPSAPMLWVSRWR